MKVYRGSVSGDVYRQQLLDIVHGGQDVEVRGLATREILDATTIIEAPWHIIQAVPGRRLNPWLALSEGLHLLAGRNDVAALEPYNRQIRKYSDDGATLYGAYGYRLKDQIVPALERLRVDPADRRVVLEIWRPEDLTAETLDPPCNTQVKLKLRGGRLYMKVECRSNDLHWGLHAVNLVEFGMLHQYMAARLGVELGYQRHDSQSLHIYREGPGQRITEQMLRQIGKPFQWQAGTLLWSLLKLEHEEFLAACNRVLDNHHVDERVPFLAFSEDFLRWYRVGRYRSVGDACRFSGVFHNWIAVAEEFVRWNPTNG